MSRNDNLRNLISDTSDDTSADENEEVTLKQLDDDLTKDIQEKLITQSIDDLEDELSQFRLQWKQELLEQQYQHNQQVQPQEKSKNLKTSSNTTNIENNNNNEMIQIQNEQKAVYLFNKGVLLEQQGRLYEAIKFYRMAMQLDPDIEFKVATNRFIKQKNENLSQESGFKSKNKSEGDNNEEDDIEDDLSLYERFQAEVIDDDNQICEKQFQQKGTHFSNLPYEVVIYILKWVVSEDLDLRSLDIFSTVCKGFYVCARDPEIWKAACEKIWKTNTGNFGSYGSWRDMYFNRPRLNFDGCYICKTSYIRTGEQSLDSFYRPWHLVEYFRFLRFFPDGTVLMLTTPEDPKLCVPRLKQKKARDICILNGNWTLNSNRVSILLVKKVLRYAVKASRRGNAKEITSNQEQFYNMELELSNVGKRVNFQLAWVSYDLHIINKLTNTESSTSFETNKIDFPPFYFSRVKSYTSVSEAPLL